MQEPHRTVFKIHQRDVVCQSMDHKERKNGVTFSPLEKSYCSTFNTDTQDPEAPEGVKSWDQDLA